METEVAEVAERFESLMRELERLRSLTWRISSQCWFFLRRRHSYDQARDSLALRSGRPPPRHQDENRCQPVEVVQAYLARIEQFDGQLHA